MQIPSKIMKNNSQGIIFVIISCQRVHVRVAVVCGMLEVVFFLHICSVSVLGAYLFKSFSDEV